jgi:hypothetical protein
MQLILSIMFNSIFSMSFPVTGPFKFFILLFFVNPAITADVQWTPP